MYFIEKTVEFDKWLKKLKDLRAKAKILFRIQKLENEEHFGEWKPVGDGISELKINYAVSYTHLDVYKRQVTVISSKSTSLVLVNSSNFFRLLL